MILEIVNGVHLLMRSLSNSVLSEGIAQTDIHINMYGWMRTNSPCINSPRRVSLRFLLRFPSGRTIGLSERGD
jgi:hypothetical protein